MPRPRRQASNSALLVTAGTFIIRAMNKIVPMISSGVAGPLGVLHLPRLWQKASLEAAGKLHPDYPGCGKGYDQMVLDGLGLNLRLAFALNF